MKIITNSKVKAWLVENGDSVRSVAQSLGISAESLSRKLHGKSEFRQREIQQLIDRYQLTPAQTCALFFSS